ncbi:MAG: 4a-hydroxytetrahydrobiopterin dehydratase [Candidatus Magasanikbacteria bacterium]|nr:4a-hydroxytetrahydrobiopterin dehydratase [Candidatus Magasanikbacteria bacterium]
MSLADKNCVPCEGGVPPLTAPEIAKLQNELKLAWTVTDNQKIRHDFKFANFRAAMEFVNKLAALAENEGHHPDLHIHYNRVIVELTTHAINGLSENDFILAKKIELI